MDCFILSELQKINEAMKEIIEILKEIRDNRKS